MELEAFAAGCAEAIILPATRDYAGASKTARNTNPKPIPEQQ
jgi:hypothetical protein